MDADFKGHAGLGVIDRNRTGEGMSNVVRQIARRKVMWFGETGFLLDRAPTRVEGLKCNHVARIDDQRGLQLTGKISVWCLRYRAQIMSRHLCGTSPAALRSIM